MFIQNLHLGMNFTSNYVLVTISPPFLDKFLYTKTNTVGKMEHQAHGTAPHFLSEGYKKTGSNNTRFSKRLRIFSRRWQLDSYGVKKEEYSNVAMLRSLAAENQEYLFRQAN